MTPSLQPQAYFPIVRQIANHLDSTTYYVRAVVRNADGDIIDTVNLESKGSQRYQSRYRVPADASGQGAYISIITSVYTDSGYTTKSGNYGDEENTYLVFDRILSGRGGGGGNLDIGTIRRVVSEEIKKAQPEPSDDPAPATPEAPEVEEIDLTPKLDAILASLDSVNSALARIPTDHVSLDEIKQAMKAIYSAIEDKEVTPATDLQPILDAVDQLAVDVLQELEHSRSIITDNESKVIDSIGKTIKKEMAGVEFKNEFKIEPTTTAKPIPQPARPAYDVSKLSI